MKASARRNLMHVNLARGLERRLERLLEGSASRVFSGRIHSSELAGRIARESDLSRYQHRSGPASANAFTLRLNPKDLSADQSSLERDLTRAFAEYAAEEGLRLEGPAVIRIEVNEDISPGKVECTHGIESGAQPSWGRLVGSETYQLGPNRVMIGRADDNDIIIPYDDVSRSHAVIFRKAGQGWIVDARSANGTFVDGRRIKAEPAKLDKGSKIHFASRDFRFVED